MIEELIIVSPHYNDELVLKNKQDAIKIKCFCNLQCYRNNIMTLRHVLVSGYAMYKRKH